MYDAILQAVRTAATSYASPFKTIEHGSLPTDAGLAIYPGPGYSPATYFDRGGTYRLIYALNGKHENLGVLLPAMSNIHKGLATATTYPSGEGWQVLLIETATPPNYLDREESEPRYWLYGSLLRVTVYFEGACNQ